MHFSFRERKKPRESWACTLIWPCLKFALMSRRSCSFHSGKLTNKKNLGWNNRSHRSCVGAAALRLNKLSLPFVECLVLAACLVTPSTTCWGGSHGVFVIVSHSFSSIRYKYSIKASKCEKMTIYSYIWDPKMIQYSAIKDAVLPAHSNKGSGFKTPGASVFFLWFCVFSLGGMLCWIMWLLSKVVSLFFSCVRLAAWRGCTRYSSRIWMDSLQIDILLAEIVYTAL